MVRREQHERARAGNRPVRDSRRDREVRLAREIAARLRVRAVALADPAPGPGRLAALVLANDSAARHVAVALGRPAVVAMGPSDPRRTAQHLERQRVLREPVACSPCGRRRCPIDHRCMTRLGPERVVAAAEELLSASAAG